MAIFSFVHIGRYVKVGFDSYENHVRINVERLNKLKNGSNWG